MPYTTLSKYLAQRKKARPPHLFSLQLINPLLLIFTIMKLFSFVLSFLRCSHCYFIYTVMIYGLKRILQFLKDIFFASCKQPKNQNMLLWIFVKCQHKYIIYLFFVFQSFSMTVIGGRIYYAIIVCVCACVTMSMTLFIE